MGLDWGVLPTCTILISVWARTWLVARRMASLVAMVQIGEASSMTTSQLTFVKQTVRSNAILGALVFFETCCHCGGVGLEIATTAKDFLVVGGGGDFFAVGLRGPWEGRGGGGGGA